MIVLLCVLHTPGNALIAKNTCHNGIGTNMCIWGWNGDTSLSRRGHGYDYNDNRIVCLVYVTSTWHGKVMYHCLNLYVSRLHNVNVNTCRPSLCWGGQVLC